MNPFLYLVLAHFLADFPFQGRWLADQKQKHVWGLFLHGFIHFAVSALLLYPLLPFRTTWIVLIVAALTHAGIDQGKIWLTRRHELQPFLGYILDQILHLIILLFISATFLDFLLDDIQKTPSSFFLDISIPGYFLILILCTYAYDVTRWTYRASETSQKIPPYKRDYKMIFRNGLIVTVAFMLYWVMR